MPPKSPDNPEDPQDARYQQKSPRHKHGEFVESELWDLDDQWNLDDETSPKKETQPSRPAAPPPETKSTPALPTQRPEAEATAEPEPKAAENPDGPPADSPPPSESESEEISEDAPDLPGEDAPAEMATQPEKPPGEPSPAPTSPSKATASAPKETEAKKADSEPAAPARRSLKTVELVSLIVLAVFLLGGLGFFVKVFLNQIPTAKQGVEMPDFPVKGERVAVTDAVNFWREPIRTGPNRDTVRSDTKLIPVVELTIEGGGNGALRIFFRDGEGLLVGDSVTRAFSGGRFDATREPKIQIAATAGFKDIAMYAAYQTGETKPWTIEVYEGPTPRAPLDSFHLLFKMPLSDEQR